MSEYTPFDRYLQRIRQAEYPDQLQTILTEINAAGLTTDEYTLLYNAIARRIETLHTQAL